MKALRRILLPLLVGVLAFGSLLQLPVEAQTSFPTAAIQALKQTLTAAGYFGFPRYATASLPACTAANLGAVAYDTTLNGTYFCNGTTWTAVGLGTGSTNTFSAVQIFSSDQGLSLGGNTTAFPLIQFNTTETVDTGMLLTGTTSNHWVIAERQDNGFDFAHAATTDPTLFIHSHNQSTTQWLSFAHDGTDAIIRAGTGAVAISTSGGTPLFSVDQSGRAQFRHDSSFGFGSSTGGAIANDTFFTREGTAIFQLGADVNGTGVAYVIKASDGITGTDKIGGNLTLSSGIGTGLGAGAKTALGRTIMGAATGTTAQTRVDGVASCESKTISNTTATATALANIALASNSSGAARVTVSVQCNDGTNFDSDLVTSYVAYVNKATVLTIGTPVTTASAAANNSGSCTVVPTFVANGTTSIDIKVTPAFTTIVPTTTTAFINVENLGPGAVTCN